MPQAELKTAYCWHCEDCAHTNFAMPIKGEFVDDKDREEYFRFFHDLDPWQDLPENWRDFELVNIPGSVICQMCGSVFETVDERGA